MGVGIEVGAGMATRKGMVATMKEWMMGLRWPP